MTVEGELLRDQLVALIGHHESEDCWYSCPKSSEGCCNENAGSECNCGAESAADKILVRFDVRLREPQARGDTMNDGRTESFKKAWASAAGQVDAATAALLRARRVLLDAGFGSGHPFCEVLDAQAAATNRTFVNLRASAEATNDV